jgi:ankyrin repeat protein
VHLASLRDYMNLAWLLVERGAIVTARDKHRSTPLHRASPGGYVDLARFLVKLGVDTTVQDNDGSTPLHLASRLPRYDVKLARLLVDHGADVTAQDKDNSTPLHQVSQDGPADLERFSMYAPVEDDLTRALERPAFYDGHIDLTKLLVEHGANVTAQ